MKALYITIFLSFVCFGCKNSETVDYDLVIANVNLIDGTGSSLQSGVNVYVNNGIIVKIDTFDVAQSDRLVEGKGKYLMPGLFDCHVHPDDYKVDFPKLMHYGVTSIFIPGGSSCTDEVFTDMRKVGNQDSISAPRVFHTSHHFTMEGRHPVKTYAGSNWVEGETVYYLRDTTQISELVAQVSKQPILGIKLTIEDGPAPPFVERIPQSFIDKTVQEARKYGLEVFAHVSDNEELSMAVKGGVQNLVHYTGVNIDSEDTAHLSLIKTLINRDASWVTTLMIDKSFLYPTNLDWFDDQWMLAQYQQRKMEITPELVKRSVFYTQLIMEEYGIESNELSDLIVPQVQDIHFLLNEGINMVLGTDAGNDFNFYGYSLHEEMQLLQMGGMEAMDIIMMGTLNAARMMHADDSLGSIEIGKLGDMILLDKNPLENIANSLSINTVFKGGIVQENLSQ